MRSVLDGHGAENYVETEFSAPSVAMDLRHGPDPRDSTPSPSSAAPAPPHTQFRERAERQRDEVLRIVTEYVVESNDIGRPRLQRPRRPTPRRRPPLPNEEDED
ncbi:hypothetical protein MBT42_18405 [Streptomyces sp. MBT42]|uniref:hypothetical protein n=1 Tax=Streptomyces sp. MBT42 TaxID=1488373 RepID=UPI001E4486BE|nr:hypothetical protein [Streptomyces sp. MBT42]MCD2465529.1 hypothetical protein [Streptomyces sp. MBT42]